MPVSDVDPSAVARVRLLLEPLARYHGFETVGLDTFPREGPCLLVVHHTLATYDGFMLAGAVWDATGRLPRGLGDDRIFQTPGLRRLARKIGLVPASPEAGEDLLRQGHILGVAPGGMWESLRPREERRRSRWGERRGFVRLALRTGAPVVLAACPRADDVYTVYKSRVTDGLYQRFHIPFPLVRGVGPTLLPRPIHLVARYSPPIMPPLYDAARESEQVEQLRDACIAGMEALLRE